MKSARDMKHCKSVQVYALAWEGKMCGSMIVHFSDNPNGSVVTVTLGAWDGPLSPFESATGSAGGYGYCKISGAFYKAIREIRLTREEMTQNPNSTALSVTRKALIETCPPGSGEHRRALESIGYQVYQCL